MIYITGDTHIPLDILKLSKHNFPLQDTLTSDDCLIVCGDFGLIWDSESTKEELYWTKWLNNKKFKILFCDGNHENHPRLNTYPIETLYNGKVHRISDNIYHLMRGEIYDIENKKIFVMGGASSHDIEWRIEGFSWWKEEIPSTEELLRGVDNLIAINNQVDYVISHCLPTSAQIFVNPTYVNDKLTDYFDELKNGIDFKRWYCGHYHINKNIKADDKYYTVLYDKIIKIGSAV